MISALKLYGERNSATNYLSNLIELNLSVTQLRGVVPEYIALLQRMLLGDEWLCDLYFSLTANHNFGWKHACVKPFLPIPDSVGIVTITKNPYAWLVSLHRTPHHHSISRQVDFETFLQSPWYCTGRDRCGKTLSNPIELWNLKNNSYLSAGSHGALNLCTEVLLSDPEQTIAMIAKQFDLSRKVREFINYDKSTSDPDKCYADYRHYYLSEMWQEQLNRKNISIINKTLDPMLMDAFEYKWL